MRFRAFILFAAILVAHFIPGTVPVTASSIEHRPAFEASANTGRSSASVVPGELLVKVRAPYGTSTLSGINRTFQAQSLSSSAALGVQQLQLPPEIDIERAAQEYGRLPYVEYAEPNHIRRALYTPNDPFFSLQWALPRIGAPDYWDSVPSNQVIVAVIDTGVNYTHPELTNKVIKGYDFINNDNDPIDDHFHGTHVAGIIAAETNNSEGIAGVAPNAKILAIKVLSKDGEGTDLQIAKGITYAADNSAKIINLSLGGPGWSSILDDAVQYARGKGCLVVASAGNDATSEPYYPASYNSVISVSATDPLNNKAYFSNFGPDIDVAAPGVDILSTYYDGVPSYIYANGTSMASPVVAGAAALILASNPLHTIDQLHRTILLSTQDLGAAGRDDSFGYGLIDLRKASTQKKTTVEETSKELTAVGVWQSTSSSNSSGGSHKSSSSAGSSLTLSFTGSSICWFAGTGSSGGIAKVYIDGSYDKDVDLYNPTTNYQMPVYYKEGLGAGNHTIKIEVSGRKRNGSQGQEINVDGFDIGNGGTSAGPQPPTGVQINVKLRSVEISWDKATGTNVAGYNIYCATSTSGKCVRVNRATVTANNFTLFPSKKNAASYYKVTAVDTSGKESAPAAPVSIKASRYTRR